MWEKGHTFDEIDGMTLEEVGDVVAYWHETERVEARRARMRKNLKGSN